MFGFANASLYILLWVGDPRITDNFIIKRFVPKISDGIVRESHGLLCVQQNPQYLSRFVSR